MFDPISQGLAAAGSQNLRAFPLVFAAGALTSVGPCVAPRFIAVASLTANRSHREGTCVLAYFVVGLVTVYAAFGASVSMLPRAATFSTIVYAVVAACLAWAGVRRLWKSSPACMHSEESQPVCGAGAPFLLGASFGLVLSPCCTPVVAGILTYSAAAGTPLYGSALLACFALGHALPIFGAGAGSRGLSSLLLRDDVRQAACVMSATLMLSLAAYYAVLV